MKSKHGGKTIKFLEGNVGEYLPDFGLRKDFLGRVQIALTINERHAHWITLILRTFVHQKHSKKVRRQVQNGRGICNTNHQRKGHSHSMIHSIPTDQ